MPYDFRKDLAFALTLHQAKNHALHFAGGVAIAIGVTLGFSRFGMVAATYASIVTVVAVVAIKEWIEQLKRYAQGKDLHIVDSLLDFVGWVLAASAVAWLWP